MISSIFITNGSFISKFNFTNIGSLEDILQSVI